MEIEAKLRVRSRSIFADLLQLTSLGAYDLEPIAGIEHQHNTYFDTPDRRLSALRYTLRVRDLGARRIATVKRSLDAEVGIHRRDEWEVAIGASDHPADWPPSEARERALAVVAGTPIIPLITIRTRRQYIYARRAALRRAELSLDEGAIMAGGRSDFASWRSSCWLTEAAPTLMRCSAAYTSAFRWCPKRVGRRGAAWHCSLARSASWPRHLVWRLSSAHLSRCD